jgi:hypothetical protein
MGNSEWGMGKNEFSSPFRIPHSQFVPGHFAGWLGPCTLTMIREGWSLVR